MYMASQRREYILRLLAERGSLRNATLARELQVTDETIRTDFIALEKKGYLRRCHGGAIYCIPSQKAEQHPASQLLLPLKEHLEQLLDENAELRIYMDHSPHGMLLLKLLEKRPLTLISNSPTLLYKLQAPSHPHHIMSTGGELDKESALLLGASAIRSLEETPPHCAILSPQQLHVTSSAERSEHISLSYTYPHATEWARHVLQHSQQCLIIGPAAMLSSSTLPPENTLHLPPSSITGIYTEESAQALHLEASGIDIPLHLAPLVEAPQYDDDVY